jgi:hypothetical protein
MSHKPQKTLDRPQWSIFLRNPLLLKIVVWLGSVGFVISARSAGANVKPVAISTIEPPAIAQVESVNWAVSRQTDRDFQSIDRQQAQIPVTPPTQPATNASLSPSTRKIVRPKHTDLLTADNYLVAVNSEDAQPKIPTESIDIPVPSPRQTAIPPRLKESVRMTNSQIVPSYEKTSTIVDRSLPTTSIQSQLTPRQSRHDRQSRWEVSIESAIAKSPSRSVVGEAAAMQRRNENRSPAILPTSISPNDKSSAGLKSKAGLKSSIVAPMKPRQTAKSTSPAQLKASEILAVDRVQPIVAKTDVKPAETPSEVCTQSIEESQVKQLLKITPSKIIPEISARSGTSSALEFSQPKPIAFDDIGSIDRATENSAATTTKWGIERLAKISSLQITDPSFTQSPQTPPPDRPKNQIALAPNTQMTIGVSAMEAKDFTDTIDPLFDTNNDDSMISRFGTRAGIYYLVAGSGVGIRHQFSSNLEGSVGVLFRSDDSLLNNKKGASQGNNKQNSNNSSDGGSIGGVLQANSFGTIAQLTYTPSQSVKVGLTYVYGHNVYPEIGSDSANRTDGGNSALGLQTFARLNPNLALGGRIGFNQNSNIEFNKNIFTWAVTAAIPDLGGKGNLAGIVIGQEPRVTAASDLNVVDTGTAMHVEGFYQIKFSDDFSITPAIIYLTGPNIDNVAPNAASIIGAIGLNYRF